MHTEFPKKDIARIIAGDPMGARRKAYEAIRARLVAEARLRHAGGAGETSLLERIRTEWKLRREVRAELKKQFPPYALYSLSRGNGRT
jgi:hypothetical protein